MNEEVLIEPIVLDFLKALYFGDFNNPYQAASKRAYRDMNRTIRFGGVQGSKRENLRSTIDQFLEEACKQVLQTPQDQDRFDQWHRLISTQICEVYRKENVKLSPGQAQKWINMTLKYLYVLDSSLVAPLLPYLHVPLDNYIFDACYSEFGIAHPNTPWSRWETYDEYMNFQLQIRRHVPKGVPPLRWELFLWL